VSSVHICREHTLDKDECKVVAEKMLDKLVTKFGGKIKQDGEMIRYRHPTGINACVEPKEGELVVDVKLGLMTKSMAPKIDQAINKELDKQLS